MQGKLTQLDARISAFKGRNVNTLPELSQVNYQSLDRIDQDLDRLKNDLKSLKEKEEYLQIQIATMPTDNAEPGQGPPQGPQGQARPAREPLLRQVS